MFFCKATVQMFQIVKSAIEMNKKLYLISLVK